jgi:hypothetical protein
MIGFRPSMTGREGCCPLCPAAWFTLGREGTFAWAPREALRLLRDKMERQQSDAVGLRVEVKKNTVDWIKGETHLAVACRFHRPEGNASVEGGQQ